MNNFIIGFKRFIRNKNTVTIIGIVLIIGLLYWGYNTQVNSAIAPRRVPVAKASIQPMTEITDEMIEMIDVPAITVSSNTITSKANVVGKFTTVNAVVPEGSMFYTNVIVAKDKLPNTSFIKVKEGESVYNFKVTTESTYGNSILPDQMIDIYMKATNEAGLIMVGKLVENVKVLAVKDSSGNDVFENTEKSRTPSMLIFGVEENIHLLLRTASYMKSFDVELFPVPHGGNANVEGATQVSSVQLKDFIYANSALVEEPDVPENNDDNTTGE